MSTKFTAWQRALAAAGKGPVSFSKNPIRRTSPWSQPIRFEGNYAEASLRGELRSSPDEAGPALASFSASPGEFDAASNQTTIRLSLTAEQTEAIPPDAGNSGVETYVFDVLLQLNPNATEGLLFGGTVQVVGRVTGE